VAAGTLSAEQQHALERIQEWHASPRAPQVMRLFGHAGSGKTYVAKEVSGAIGGNVHFAAFTGKAASVLASRGCEPVSTLHSLIYMPVGEMRAGLSELDRRIRLCLDQNSAHCKQLKAERAMLQAKLRSPQFRLKEGRTSPLHQASLLVVDEVSMVGRQMAEDILSFGKKVLVLGDPEQLPPVGSEGYFTDADPDILLRTIHRQDGDSEILELATRVRSSGADPRRGLTVDDYLPGVDLADLGGYDQILCGRNATRWWLNTWLRYLQGRKGLLPEPGERIVCLANNRDLGVYNGQQFSVISADEVGVGRLDLELEDDLGNPVAAGALTCGFEDPEGERVAASDGCKGEFGAFTWSYALTCHRSQGSEWNKVLVVDEAGVFSRSGVDTPRRWLYTAVTRARETVHIVRPEHITPAVGSDPRPPDPYLAPDAASLAAWIASAPTLAVLTKLWEANSSAPTWSPAHTTAAKDRAACLRS
jgi:exodeoxyribonuclease V